MSDCACDTGMCDKHRIYTMPSGPGWTDGSDARENVQRFIDAVPDRSTIRMPAGLVTSVPNLKGRSHLSFVGVSPSSTPSNRQNGA